MSAKREAPRSVDSVGVGLQHIPRVDGISSAIGSRRPTPPNRSQRGRLGHEARDVEVQAIHWAGPVLHLQGGRFMTFRAGLRLWSTTWESAHKLYGPLPFAFLSRTDRSGFPRSREQPAHANWRPSTTLHFETMNVNAGFCGPGNAGNRGYSERCHRPPIGLGEAGNNGYYSRELPWLIASLRMGYHPQYHSVLPGKTWHRTSITPSTSTRRCFQNTAGHLLIT